VGVGYSHQNVLGTASRFDVSANINRQLFFGLYSSDYGDIMSNRYDSFSVVDQIERELRVGLQSPRFKTVIFDPLARIDLIHERENAISYSLDSVTGILGVDFAPTENITFGLGPELSYTNLDCIDLESGTVLGEQKCVDALQSTSTAGRSRINAGTRTSVSVTPTLTLDFRDNPFNPTRGYYFNVKTELATGRRRTPEEDAEGVTRFQESDFSFAKVEGVVSGYLPAPAMVLAASARAGVIALVDGTDVPIDERFFLGGRSTLRGFAEGGTLIPEDACVYLVDDLDACADVPEANLVSRTEDTPPVTPGGQFYLLFKLEARIPLTAVSENLSAALFLDFGNLWIDSPSLQDLSFRVGAGAGIRYATPVGPLALDVGFNTAPRTDWGEETLFPHFTVGVF
jgi:outer membrane protein assembly factor BamA